MSGDLTIFLFALGAGALALVLRCYWKKKPPTPIEILGVGIAAAGISTAIDVFAFAIENEKILGAFRVKEICVGSLVTFGAALYGGMEVFSAMIKPNATATPQDPP